MRAEAVDRAIIAGWSEGGSLAAFFAATYPERTEGLILSGAYASWVRRDDHPWAPTQRSALRSIWLGSLAWGTGELAVRAFAPSMRGQPGFRRWAARYERASISRRNFVPFCRLVDRARHPPRAALHLRAHARHARPRGSRPVPVQGGRYLGRAHRGRPFRGAPDRRPRGLVRRAGCLPRRDAAVPHRHAPERGPLEEARNRPLHRHRRLDSERRAGRRRRLARSAWTVTTTCATARLVSAAAAGSRARETACWPPSTARAVPSDARGRLRDRIRSELGDRDPSRAAHRRDRDARRRRGRDDRCIRPRECRASPGTRR